MARGKFSRSKRENPSFAYTYKDVLRQAARVVASSIFVHRQVRSVVVLASRDRDVGDVCRLLCSSQPDKCSTRAAAYQTFSSSARDAYDNGFVDLDIQYPHTRRGDVLGGGELVALGIIYRTTDRPARQIMVFH